MAEEDERIEGEVRDDQEDVLMAEEMIEVPLDTGDEARVWLEDCWWNRRDAADVEEKEAVPMIPAAKLDEPPAAGRRPARAEEEADVIEEDFVTSPTADFEMADSMLFARVQVRQ